MPFYDQHACSAGSPRCKITSDKSKCGETCADGATASSADSGFRWFNCIAVKYQQIMKRRRKTALGIIMPHEDVHQMQAHCQVGVAGVALSTSHDADKSPTLLAENFDKQIDLEHENADEGSEERRVFFMTGLALFSFRFPLEGRNYKFVDKFTNTYGSKNWRFYGSSWQRLAIEAYLEESSMEAKTGKIFVLGERSMNKLLKELMCLPSFKGKCPDSEVFKKKLRGHTHGVVGGRPLREVQSPCWRVANTFLEYGSPSAQTATPGNHFNSFPQKRSAKISELETYTVNRKSGKHQAFADVSLNPTSSQDKAKPKRYLPRAGSAKSRQQRNIRNRAPTSWSKKLF